MESTLFLENIKCRGCGKSIEKEIRKSTEIEDVKVDFENGFVWFSYSKIPDLEQIKNRLKNLGYPENGSLSGIENLAAQAKSYISCAIGKMS
jgi:copper chaperone